MKIFEGRKDYQLAYKICEILQAKGFIAYIAGGAVRDFILERSPGDFDVATSATPEQVEALFPKTVGVGKVFGVILVVEEGLEIEVASFRKDGLYVDGRRPESVQYSSPAEDAERRDFTMNAIFYDPINKKIHDFVGGEADIKNKLLRAVGEAKARFQEDHLRILRALRQATELGFQIEKKTWQAICDLQYLAKQVSGERYFAEMSKLLMSEQVEKGLCLLADSGIEKNINLDPWSRKQSILADRWFRFFFSLHSSVLSLSGSHLSTVQTAQTQTTAQAIKHGFAAQLSQLKCSKELKHSLQKGFFWFENNFLELSVGALVEKNFDPDYQRGFIEFFMLPKTASETEIYKKVQGLLLKFNHLKPEAFLKAQDLPKLQGASLGKALKESYFAQLEGVVKTKQEALDWCQQRFAC